MHDISYKDKHKDTIKLKLEVIKVSKYLKKKGYFLSTVNIVKINKQRYVAYFSLNKRTKKAMLKINEASRNLFKDLIIENDIISIPIDELQTTLFNISKKLDDQGKSFSKVQLKNINIYDDTLFADLEINQSKKRILNQVIVKGYENFPKSYLKNYFRLDQNAIFNQNKIEEISDLTKKLNFITEIKPPEALFTNDSTRLYLYLKKKNNNSIDGVVSFASKENGDLLFNGNIDLKLSNVLNSGEKIELLWNSIEEEKQEFEFRTKIPYLFKSKFSSEVYFNIYKQDSTFLNTKFDSKLVFNLTTKIDIALTYNTQSSENLKENINNEIETFTNYFFGIKFRYNIPKNDFFFNDKFNFEINPTLGNRKTTLNNSNQFKIETITSYLWDLNLRNSIFIKNETGYLNSDSFLNNELFRIGGANSIRGFDEQSIFTNNYTFFNIEYRFLTSQKSYIYSVTDIGAVNIGNNKENLLGLGLGYLFTTNNSQIKLSSVIGKNSLKNFNIKASKFIINWINYF